MSHKHEQQHPVPKAPKPVAKAYAMPFLIVLAVLTVVAFLIPLRPTVSEREKRELTKFPPFSAEALLSGEYFDDITLWFSDTFPGREAWLDAADYTKSLHGYGEISIVEDAGIVDQLLNPVADDGSPTPAPTPTPWGGIDAGDDAEITMGAIIQIGDSAFNRLGFSETNSIHYTKTLNKLGEKLAEKGVRLISAPSPTAIGIMVEEQYLKKLNSADQNETLAYLHDSMNEHVITVDTVSALLDHNSEYLFFRTDHHWTALGAYYSYAAVCETLGMEPASLSDFTEWDKGEFRGSHASKVARPQKLRWDNLVAYIPPQEIQVNIVNDWGLQEAPLLRDVSESKIYSKYSTFLGTDYPLMELVNPEIEDDSTCLVVKDSFGNCFAPFVTQNYHKVYVMDYRKYHRMGLNKFVEKYEVDDVWFIPYMIATQSADGNKLFENLCR